jgi:hypothetical protein
MAPDPINARPGRARVCPCEKRQHGKTQEEEPEAANVQLECPAEFGNSDIWGIALADPAP